MDKSKMCDHKVSSVQPDTSSSYLRKIKKPLIERKRRERINNCLSQLKAILLETVQQNGGTQVCKLDKADILEMTVSYLRQVHQHQLSTAMVAGTSAVQQYQDGYTECASETIQYMEATRLFPEDMVLRMRTHVSNKAGYPCINSHTNRNIVNDFLMWATPVECINKFGSSNTPVNVKIECADTFVPLSPNDNTRHTLTPLLMPVQGTKPETDCSIGDSSATSSTHTHTKSHDIVECKPLQNSYLEIPQRIPVFVEDSPPTKQVWRPF